MLTQAKTDRFREDGFVTQQNVFTPDEVAALLEACESGRTVETLRERKYHEQHVHLLSLTTFDKLFRDLACDPRIVEKVAQLIGPTLQLQHSKLTCQPRKKGIGGFAWHQDFAFFQHTNTDLCAVMVYLDDTDVDNGCMYMVKGSHKLGLLEHRDAEGYFTSGCREGRYLSEAALEGRRVPVEVKAGGISIHHCLTLHGSRHNKSGRPRRGIVFQYRNAEAYQLCDTVFPDTGWHLRGEARDVIRCDAGTIYLSRRKIWDQPFGNMYHQAGPQAEDWNAQPELPTPQVRTSSTAD